MTFIQEPLFRFDKYGYLSPYQILTTNLDTFENIFVSQFTNSITRLSIFEQYLAYTKELRELLQNPFYQWIDGSYITNVLNPKDIDLITWVDSRDYEVKANSLSKLREFRFRKGSLIDGYILPIYPTNHSKNILNEINEKQWLFDWAYDDDNKPKGIIKIQF